MTTKKPYRINNQDVVVKATNAVYNGTISGVDNAQSAIDSLAGRVAAVEQGNVFGANGKVQLRMLFIGNSLTQDAVAYLPLVLNEFKDYIDYKIYLWYTGGKNLTQLYTIFTNNTKAEIFSVCDNAPTWTNQSNAVSMATVLSTYTDFTLVSLQEYFNYKRESGYTAADKQSFNDIVDYISARHVGDFDVYSFWHRPMNRMSSTSDPDYELTDQEIAAKIFNLTRDGLIWQVGSTNGVKNTASKGIIPCGIAAYRSMDVPQIDSLGSHANHHMSSDGTHAQEGLPCLMQAWVLAQWVFDTLGLPFDCGDSMVRCTSTNVTALNVPGSNGSRIDGTEEQNRAANSVAVNAYLEGLYVAANGKENVNPWTT